MKRELHNIQAELDWLLWCERKNNPDWCFRSTPYSKRRRRLVRTYWALQLERFIQSKLDQKQDTPTLEEYATTGRDVFHRPKCSERWYVETEFIMTKHILPFFGEMHLGDISTATVQSFYNAKAASGYATSTIKHIKCLLSQILDSAVEDDLIPKNPLRSKRLTIIRRETKRMPLTARQVNDILLHLHELDEQQQLIIVLPLFSGMRCGEMLALTWGDIDLDANVIHITKAVEFRDGNSPTIKFPKTKAGIRNLPITQDLKPYLDKCKQSFNRYVIGNGLQPISKRAYDWRFTHLPINLYGATAHVFRHTYATIAATRTDPKTLQGLLGHAKCDITMNRYAHFIQDDLTNACKQLTGMYNG